MWGPKGAWPHERPGSPHETSGLRWYKGTCKRPHEITHQSMIATYHSKHQCWCFLLPQNVTSGPGASRGPQEKFSRLAIAYHILRPPHKLCYHLTTAQYNCKPGCTLYMLQCPRQLATVAGVLVWWWLHCVCSDCNNRNINTKVLTGYKNSKTILDIKLWSVITE